MTPEIILKRFELSDGARLVFSEVIDRYGIGIAKEAMKDWGKYPPSLQVFEYRCQSIAQQAAIGRANFLLMEYLNSEKKLGADWEQGFNGAEVVSRAITALGGYAQVKYIEKGGGLLLRDQLKAKIIEVLIGE